MSAYGDDSDKGSALSREAGQLAREWLIRMDGDAPLTRAEKAVLKEFMGRSPLHRDELFRLQKLWQQFNILTELIGLVPDRRRSSPVDRGTVLYDVSHATGIPPGDITRLASPRIAVVQAGLAERLQRFPEAMHTLSPRQFEMLLAELLTDKGLEVQLTPQTHDGGSDLLAYQRTDVGALLFLVECKKYDPMRKVGVDLVRNLYGTLALRGASHAILATTSTFTRDAHELQRQRPYQLSLHDYTDIIRWVRHFGATRSSFRP